MFNASEANGKTVTYNLMTLICKFLLISPNSFKQCLGSCQPDKCSCDPADKCFGRAKYYALKGDGKAVRAVVEACGGSKTNLAKLQDNDLVELWGVNEHHDIHCCGFGAPEFFHAVHATSLNDCAAPHACAKGTKAGLEGGQSYIGGREEDHWEKNGPTGGFNDKGNYEQHGYFYHAKNTLKYFGVDEPPQ